MNEVLDQFVLSAESCIGTPFHHQGRLKGVGLDCIGLVVHASKAVGYTVKDNVAYSVRPDGKSLVAALESHGAYEVNEIQKGDILLFRYDSQPQHVAIACDEKTMIHAFAPARAVVKTKIGRYWKHRLLGVYRIIWN